MLLLRDTDEVMCSVNRRFGKPANNTVASLDELSEQLDKISNSGFKSFLCFDYNSPDSDLNAQLGFDDEYNLNKVVNSIYQAGSSEPCSFDEVDADNRAEAKEKMSKLHE